MEAFMSMAAQLPPVESKSAPAPISAQTPSPTSAPSSGGGYSLARPLGKCSVCDRVIPPGEKFFAAVRDGAAGLERVDISTDCWETFDRAPLLAFWQTVMPAANAAKAKIFVDDTVLCDLFARLGDSAQDAAKLNFRFVLGLILMRKRLLVYESTRVDGQQEIWTVRFKGKEETIDLLNPRLNEEQIAEVGGQLGQILSGDLA
jgi:hypothetical protein